MVMQEWFERIVGPEYAFPAMVAVAALVALLLLFLLWRIIRHYSAGTYVAGGRNRKTRLAIMDATPVDAHRRLVLVRRDDVEHLLLIGGAADVVVERDIRLSGQARRPAAPSRAACRSLAKCRARRSDTKACCAARGQRQRHSPSRARAASPRLYRRRRGLRPPRRSCGRRRLLPDRHRLSNPQCLRLPRSKTISTTSCCASCRSNWRAARLLRQRPPPLKRPQFRSMTK